MAFEGLWEMFEGDFADMCANKSPTSYPVKLGWGDNLSGFDNMLRYLHKFRCNILGPFGEENCKLGVKNQFKAVAP